MKKRVIYSCITLQKELENTIKKIGFEGKVNYLNVALHSDPQKMHETLQGIIDANTEADYLCFRLRQGYLRFARHNLLSCCATYYGLHRCPFNRLRYQAP